MSACPKCCVGTMTGPRYHRDSYGSECLIYRCATCGYVQERPTHDAEKRQWPAPKLPEGGTQGRGE